MGTIHADAGGKSRIRYPTSATASAAAAATATTDHLMWSDAAALPGTARAPRLTPTWRLHRSSSSHRRRRRRRRRSREGVV